MSDMINRTLKRYKVSAKLGTGGMGTVYQGMDSSLNRVVAIKVMHPQYADDPVFRQRFLQEARVAANLDHPGIVKVFDFDEFQGTLFIVMEFISGKNLSQWLTEQRAAHCWISIGDAVELVRQVGLALQHAHESGVLHRDIKPANIMIKKQAADRLPYRPVITDLGLAKLVEGMQFTHAGESMGTPAYMSPEQALGEKVDARSDVYSLGILLYQLAVGQLPFASKTPSEAIRDHTQKPPPPPTTVQPGFPAELEQIMLKSLEKDPGKRFQSAVEFANKLESFLDETPDALTSSTLIEDVSPQDLGTIFVKQEDLGGEASAPHDFDQTPAGFTGNIIHVHSPNQADRAVPLKVGTITIGRVKNNDIVLDDPAVSRVHVHIKFDGTSCRVIDQNSSNGTYMANNRLLAGVGENWTIETPLRIGSHLLRWKFTQQVLSNASQSLDFQPTSVSQEKTIGLTLDPPQISVDPGQSSQLTVELKNLGATVDHYHVSVEGIPTLWVGEIPETVQLMPGEVKSVLLNFHPPHHPKSRAGRHSFSVCVMSQSRSSEFVKQKAILTIGHYSQFMSQLHPQKLHSGTLAQLKIENQGNLPDTYAVRFEDRGDEVAFEVSHAQVTIPDGQQAIVTVRPRPRKTPWFGRETSFLFSAKVNPGSGDVQTHSGEVVSRALIPIWVLLLVFFLCVSLIGLFAAIRPIIFPTSTPTPHPTVSPTPEPGMPILEEWCIYPEGAEPAALINRPIQVKAMPGEKLIVRWRVSNAQKVEIMPFGNQPLSGQIPYEFLETRTITLKATNADKVIEKMIEVLVLQPTPVLPPILPTSPTPSPSQLPTSIPVETSTPDNRQAVQLTGFDMINMQMGWGEWANPFGAATNLYRTEDGGLTWSDITPPSGYPIGSRFFALDGQRAWAALWGTYTEGGGVVWRTSDGGLTWLSSAPVQPGLPEYNVLPGFIPKAMYFLDEQHGWLVVAVDYVVSPGVLVILATTDGGQTWQQIADQNSMSQSPEGTSGYANMPCNVNGIAFVDLQNGYMAGDCFGEDSSYGFTVLNTMDGGRTWLAIFTNPTNLPQELQTAMEEGRANCGATGVENTPGGILVQHTCKVMESSDVFRDYYYLSFLPTGSSIWLGWAGETASFANLSEGYSLEQSSEDGKRNLNVTTDGGSTWQIVGSVSWANARLDFPAPGQGFSLAWRWGDQAYASLLVRTADGGQSWVTVEGVVK